MNSFGKEIFTSALKKNSPANLIKKSLKVRDGYLKIDDDSWGIENRQLFIIAVGKASEEMCRALAGQLKVDASNYICIAPHSDGSKHEQKKHYFYSSHPYPDKKSERAARELINFVKNIPDESLVLFALSGGASSLVCKPANGIQVDEIAQVNKLLLHSGASIDEINSIRKHLSEIKGGQLLTCFQPHITLVDLVISDVPGDDLEIIGSGLTIPDSSTFQDAYHVLLQYDLWDEIPKAARKHIEKGLTGEVYETMKPRENVLPNHQSFIIGSAKEFAQTVAREAEDRGYTAWVATKYYDGSVGKIIGEIMAKIKQVRNELDKPHAIIYYGESTVNITGDGKGGRNQQMALEAATQIADMENIKWLSGGTDGIDGPTDAAGAIVDGKTVLNAKEKGLDAHAFLNNNDSYYFHEQMNTLLKTGPTGNNLMDIVLVLLD